MLSPSFVKPTGPVDSASSGGTCSSGRHSDAIVVTHQDHCATVWLWLHSAANFQVGVDDPTEKPGILDDLLEFSGRQVQVVYVVQLEVVLVQAERARRSEIPCGGR